jgi:formate dehydrogenase
LVRNYNPSYQWVVKGGWNIAGCGARSDDLEGMQLGTVAAGRIGSAVLRRLKPGAYLERSGVTGAAHLGLAS